MLNERVQKEIDEQNILPDVQREFREDRGAMDNVYILQPLAAKELSQKVARLYTLFVGFKVTFDSVNGEIMEMTEKKRNK